MGCFGVILGSFGLSTILALTLAIGLWRGDWTTVREEIVDSVHVQASRQRIWAALTEWEEFDEWHPVVSEVRGNKTAGSLATIRLRAFPLVALPVQVLAYYPGEKLRWMHWLALNGFMTIEHEVLLKDGPSDGVVKVQHAVYWRGILVPYLFPLLADSWDAGVVATNRELKARAEQK